MVFCVSQFIFCAHCVEFRQLYFPAHLFSDPKVSFSKMYFLSVSFSLHRMRTIRSPSPLLLHPFSKKILAKLGKLESESATTTFLKIYFSQVSDCSVNDKCEKYFRTPIKTVQQLGAIFAEKFPLLTEFLARWK